MEQITFREPLQILGIQILTDGRGQVDTPAASHFVGPGCRARPGEGPAILRGVPSVA
jgi:hypothetical protein